ncbi:unnamed protein product [Amoebophrya sp. A120]|nr:unnamed protein product [Amoebophrya sp. A120]|eukprot:GSA120T00020771001.1
MLRQARHGRNKTSPSPSSAATPTHAPGASSFLCACAEGTDDEFASDNFSENELFVCDETQIPSPACTSPRPKKSLWPIALDEASGTTVAVWELANLRKKSAPLVSEHVHGEGVQHGEELDSSSLLPFLVVGKCYVAPKNGSGAIISSRERVGGTFAISGVTRPSRSGVPAAPADSAENEVNALLRLSRRGGGKNRGAGLRSSRIKNTRKMNKAAPPTIRAHYTRTTATASEEEGSESDYTTEDSTEDEAGRNNNFVLKMLACFCTNTCPRSVYVVTELCQEDLHSRLRQWFCEDRKDANIKASCRGGAPDDGRSCHDEAYTTTSPTSTPHHVRAFLRRQWVRQLCRGVAYLHDRGVGHRDLSLENVLLLNDDVRIADFGRACALREEPKTEQTKMEVELGPRESREKPAAPAAFLERFRASLGRAETAAAGKNNYGKHHSKTSTATPGQTLLSTTPSFTSSLERPLKRQRRVAVRQGKPTPLRPGRSAGAQEVVLGHQEDDPAMENVERKQGRSASTSAKHTETNKYQLGSTEPSFLMREKIATTTGRGKKEYEQEAAGRDEQAVGSNQTVYNYTSQELLHPARPREVDASSSSEEFGVLDMDHNMLHNSTSSTTAAAHAWARENIKSRTPSRSKSCLQFLRCAGSGTTAAHAAASSLLHWIRKCCQKARGPAPEKQDDNCVGLTGQLQAASATGAPPREPAEDAFLQQKMTPGCFELQPAPAPPYNFSSLVENSPAVLLNCRCNHDLAAATSSCRDESNLFPTRTQLPCVAATSSECSSGSSSRAERPEGAEGRLGFCDTNPADDENNFSPCSSSEGQEEHQEVEDQGGHTTTTTLPQDRLFSCSQDAGCGRATYCAPELVLRAHYYPRQTDSFAVGMCILRIYLLDRSAYVMHTEEESPLFGTPTQHAAQEENVDSWFTHFLEGAEDKRTSAAPRTEEAAFRSLGNLLQIDVETLKGRHDVDFETGTIAGDMLSAVPEYRATVQGIRDRLLGDC